MKFALKNPLRPLRPLREASPIHHAKAAKAAKGILLSLSALFAFSAVNSPAQKSEVRGQISQVRNLLPPLPSIPQRPSSETLSETKPFFAVTCPHCHGAFKLTARSAYVTGGRATDGGIITERALTFICPSLDCGQPFTAHSEKFSPTVIATELVDQPPRARPQPSLPPTPLLWLTNSGGGSISLVPFLTNSLTPWVFVTNLNGSITQAK